MATGFRPALPGLAGLAIVLVLGLGPTGAPARAQQATGGAPRAAPVAEAAGPVAFISAVQEDIVRLRLADTGEPTRIDLAALPFGPGDEKRLLGWLGRGEVSATIDALGPTRRRRRCRWRGRQARPCSATPAAPAAPARRGRHEAP